MIKEIPTPETTFMKTKNYIKCFECESKINVGDDYFVEERESDGVQVPYCPKCYGRTLDDNDGFIEMFWTQHAGWAGVE